MVNEVLSNDNHEIARESLRYRNHYVCNLGKDNEKGKVETQGGYYYRNMLAPVPKIDGLKAFNVHLPGIARPGHAKVSLLNAVPTKGAFRG